MRNAAVPKVLHHETAVFEDVEMVANMDPSHLGHLRPLVLIVGGTVSLADKEVVVGLRSDKPEDYGLIIVICSILVVSHVSSSMISTPVIQLGL